jgi:hypothetical protein
VLGIFCDASKKAPHQRAPPRLTDFKLLLLICG